MADLKIENLSRRYGPVAALKDLNLEVADGEFVSLLGPSGCGKSTTLGIIAGLDQPTEGRITVGGRVMADAEKGILIAAEDRDIGLVLQSYALWPHMTVRQNISLPLEIRGITKSKRNDRIDEYLSFVEMGAYGDRYPHELSGGQQQRVALARTLVYEPVMLLLDEPLSNVDAKLRERARTWLRQLQRRFGVTTIFVTHDQSEALTMSDRIAVMSEGKMMQYGTPIEVYSRPNAPFVADFVGSSNFLSGSLLKTSGLAQMQVGDGVIRLPNTDHIAAGSAILLAVRPEKIKVVSRNETRDTRDDNLLKAKIVHRDFLGSRCLYHAETGGQTVRFESSDLTLSDDVQIGFSSDDTFVFRA
jgi:iron(III) transport system ATP-binding protein